MTKTVVLTISLIAVFAALIISIPLVHAAGHVVIVETELEVTDVNILDVEIDVAADIPEDGSAGAFGYGIFTDGFNNVLALTTHAGILDSPVQEDLTDPVFHPHVLDLAPTSALTCDGFDAVVDLVSTIGSGNDVNPEITDFDVDGDTLDISDIFADSLLGDSGGPGNVGVETIATFTITVVADDLCLTVITFQGLPPGP